LAAARFSIVKFPHRILDSVGGECAKNPNKCLACVSVLLCRYVWESVPSDGPAGTAVSFY